MTTDYAQILFSDPGPVIERAPQSRDSGAVCILSDSPWEAGMSNVIFATTNPGAKQFDSLAGQWNAGCHLALPNGSWGGGPGSMTAGKVLDGCVSPEFFEGPCQGTIIKGLGLLRHQSADSQWERTWTDTSARVVSWSGADDLKAAPSTFTASGRMRLGAMFSSGSHDPGSRSGPPTGRVTPP
jgi:hypothetical protein